MVNETIIVGAPPPLPHNEEPGAWIGPFRIIKKIGEGGFGSVFEAEQEQPVRRTVALKIIKLGMDTREVIARFDAERQALAMMDHPHIARVFDAGATESGRPYFAMELVHGEPISAYCIRHALSLPQRLALFEQVCAAVQHAHGKGVIHRDLKPNNVLVSTEDGQPFTKVIDFGIAKATTGRLTDQTLMTEVELMMGTPLYMSPEQAAGSADIDTRTDIYALGVILYELLTDSTPIDSSTLRGARLAEIQRIISEVEPLRPSARLTRPGTLQLGETTRSSSEVRKRAAALRGELDWIVMKAIDKNRTRRYETASAFAADIRSYLDGEPVQAAPPSALYRLRKTIARNRALVAATAAVLIALLIGAAGFAWQAKLATTRADELYQVTLFQANMLSQVDATSAGLLLSDDVQSQLAAALEKTPGSQSEHATRREQFTNQWQLVNATDAARNLIDSTILKPAAAAIGDRFENQPFVAAALRQVLASRYAELGLYDAALPLQTSALETRMKLLGEDNRETTASMNSMCVLLGDRGELTEAEAICRRALASRRRVLGPDHPSTLESLNNLGILLGDTGAYDEAEAVLRESLMRHRNTLGNDDPNTIDAMNNLSNLLTTRGKLEEAEELLRKAVDLSRRVSGESSSAYLIEINNLGAVLYKQDKLAEAEPYFREALQKSRKLLGDAHPDTLLSISNLGMLLQNEGKLDAAENLNREALEKMQRVLGQDHPSTLTVASNLSMLLMDQGKLGDAEPLLREVLDTSRRVSGEDHPDTLFAISNLAVLLHKRGDVVQAERYLREGLERSQRTLGDADPLTRNFNQKLGYLLTRLGKPDEAAAYLQATQEQAERAVDP